MSIKTTLENEIFYPEIPVKVQQEAAPYSHPEVLDALDHMLPAPAIWFDEQIYIGDVVYFYDRMYDKDGWGTLVKVVTKSGREYGRIMQVKIWTRRDYMQDGILYQYGDVYEEEIDIPLEQIELADTMLNDEDVFNCVNYNVEVC